MPSDAKAQKSDLYFKEWPLLHDPLSYQQHPATVLRFEDRLRNFEQISRGIRKDFYSFCESSLVPVDSLDSAPQFNIFGLGLKHREKKEAAKRKG